MNLAQSLIKAAEGELIGTADCTRCGRLFFALRRGAYSSRNCFRFCSRECAWKTQFQNSSTVVPCPTCGRSNRFPLSRIRKGNNTFCNQTCYGSWSSRFRRGASAANWQGGTYLNAQGYRLVKSGHAGPGYVMEHRVVWEKHHDRALREFEHLHHINGDRTDNRIENLELWGVVPGSQPKGQRIPELIRHFVRHYPVEVCRELARTKPPARRR